MKVFNEEVNCCQDCPFLNHVGMAEDSYCNKLHKDVTEHSIDKDCPFNKPITKEVIEGFGFVKDITLIFQKPDLIIVETTEVSNSKYYKMVYSFRYKTCEIMDCEDSTLFLGNINNPQELEFVLRSIGVIE